MIGKKYFGQKVQQMHLNERLNLQKEIKKLNPYYLSCVSYNTNGDSVKNVPCLLPTVLTHIFFYFSNRNSNSCQKNIIPPSFLEVCLKCMTLLLLAELSLGYLAPYDYVIFCETSCTLCRWLLHHISNIIQWWLCPHRFQNLFTSSRLCYEAWMNSSVKWFQTSLVH